MKYNSTRGKVKGLSFKEALFTGLLTDGGLALPERIPTLSKGELRSWSRLSYPELVKRICSLYISEEEIPKEDLDGIIDRAYKGFHHEDIVPIVKLKDGLQIHELFHGATLAFKDCALSCLGQFMDYFIQKDKKHLIIIVGTSGDTGSAAIEAVRNLKEVDIIVLLPKGLCSNIQELMMTTVLAHNVHVYRVEGNSDDLDVPIMETFLNEEFVKKYNISGINSINWARIMIQTAHYFYAYLKTCPNIDGDVQMIVPTGACGNITGGIVAQKMGLPIKLVSAVNSNNIVQRTIINGDFSPIKHVHTLSPAMDIRVPYNMERLFYLFSDGDTERVKSLMENFEENGKLDVPKDILDKLHETIIGSYSYTDEQVIKTMKRTWDENKYLICPHTAVGVSCFYELHASNKMNIPTVCIATASPAKFAETVELAGLKQTLPPRVAALYEKQVKFEEMKKGENWLKILQDKVLEISNRS